MSWMHLVSLAAALLLAAPAGCSDDSGGKQDAGSEHDASLACPPSKPSGHCDASIAPVCSYGTDTCACTVVCSGVRPPPGQTHEWACTSPPPADCPRVPPGNDSTCSPNGTKCSWGTCGVTQAECIDGKWNVNVVPPPP